MPIDYSKWDKIGEDDEDDEDNEVNQTLPALDALKLGRKGVDDVHDVDATASLHPKLRKACCDFLPLAWRHKLWAFLVVGALPHELVIAVAVSLESILCGLARQCVNGLYEIVSRQGLEQYRLSFASSLYLVIDGLAQDETTQHIKGAHILEWRHALMGSPEWVEFQGQTELWRFFLLGRLSFQGMSEEEIGEVSFTKFLKVTVEQLGIPRDALTMCHLLKEIGTQGVILSERSIRGAFQLCPYDGCLDHCEPAVIVMREMLSVNSMERTVCPHMRLKKAATPKKDPIVEYYSKAVAKLLRDEDD